MGGNKVIDAIIFNNELDLLEIRLNILDKYVDKFVIVEANETFTGLPKPLYFQENKERYKKWEHKIVHHVIDNDDLEIMDFARKSPNTGNGEHWWLREFYQKESMIKALNFNDEDIVFISDLDEIWNPKMKLDWTKDVTYRPKQTAYHYFLNNRSDQEIGGWTGTRVAKLKTIKKFGPNHFRTERENPSILVENGGWHFSYMGGADEIKNKIKAFGHQEYRTEAIFNSIQQNIDNNKDFLNRGFNLWKDESQLPDYLINNKEKWIKHFLS